MQETFDTPASRFLTYAGVWFAVLAWGTSFVAARFLLHPEKPGQATLSPLVLAAARFSIASLFFVVPLARALLHRQITRRDLLRMVVLGQLTFSLYFWLQYTGVQQTNASISRRSEEHTSELQSRRDLVCRLLLEKKKKKKIITNEETK